MTRLFTGLLLAGAAALGLWTWLLLVQPTAVADAATVGAARRLPDVTAAAVRDESQRRRDEVTTILARPVFSPTRRPKTDAAGQAATAAPITALPRMTAILISGKLRSAIFDGDGKATVLGVGGRLGPFTVQSIEPQQVTIIGPEGKRVVRTTFSNDPPPAMAPPMLPQVYPPPLAPVVLPTGMPLPGMPIVGRTGGLPLMGTSR